MMMLLMMAVIIMMMMMMLRMKMVMMVMMMVRISWVNAEQDGRETQYQINSGSCIQAFEVIIILL